MTILKKTNIAVRIVIAKQGKGFKNKKKQNKLSLVHKVDPYQFFKFKYSIQSY